MEINSLFLAPGILIHKRGTNQVKVILSPLEEINSFHNFEELIDLPNFSKDWSNPSWKWTSACGIQWING